MKNKVSDIVVSIIIFGIGICLLLWAESVINIVSILLGALLIINGIFNAIAYFKNQDNKAINITAATFKIVIGTILLAKPSLLSEIISFIIGLFILITSIANLINTLNNKNANNYNVTLGLSITGIIIGILCIIGKFLIPNIILEFIGLMLIIFSIVNIIDTILLANENKSNQKQIIDIK